MRILSLAASIVVLAIACSDVLPTAPTGGDSPEGAGALTATTEAVADPSGISPGVDDRMLVDTRASLQQVTSFTGALSSLGSGVTTGGTWAFTSDVDGAGTHALRVDWPMRSTTSCTFHYSTLTVPLPTPAPTRLVVQWKQHLGRTATGGGVGNIGEFAMTELCEGIARTEMMVPYVGTSDRVDYSWRGSPLTPHIKGGGARVYPLASSAFHPEQSVGRTLMQTLYLQAESAAGAADGIVRLWVDGALVMDRADVALTPAAFSRLRFPGKLVKPLKPQSEYFWDIVAWEPVTPPAPGGGGTPEPVETIVVTPAAVTLTVGSTAQLAATLLSATGDTLRNRAITWVSSAPDVATVSAQGLVSGVKAGTLSVVATAEEKSGSSTITVEAAPASAPVASVTVTGSTATLQPGQTVQLTATVRDSNNTVLTNRPVTWSSGTPSVATVSSSGLVTAVAGGSVTITATSEGVAGTYGLTVTAASPPPPTGSRGMWISPEEIAALPMSGPAWTNLKAAADRSCGTPNLENQDDPANVCIMAKALVFARTGQTSYRDAVVAALRSIVNAGTYGGRALALGRELAAYPISADLIGLPDYDAILDAKFRAKLIELRTTYTSNGPANLIICHERRPNNWGTSCSTSRVAIAVYLGDQADLARAAQVFRGWLGERSVYASFVYGDLSWQADPANPVGINPVGATKNGHSIDGVLPDDQRRAGSFTWPPPKENYVYTALEGVIATALILHRQGYDVFNWSDRAILRAYVWLHQQADFPAVGNDTWQPHLVNHIYGTSFPAPIPSIPGKNVGWTDWTHPPR